MGAEEVGMPKDRARQRTYGPQELVPKQTFPTVPPESVWAGLTETERRFVLGYLEHGDVRKAFVDSGQEHGQKYVRQCAYLYLGRPKIKAAVARGMAFYAEQVGLHSWQILGALHGAAFHDPAQLYEEDAEGGWQFKKMAEWPLASRQAIKKIRVEESPSEHGMKRRVEVEFSDRLHALALLGKHMKLFEKSQQVAPFTLILNANAEPVEKQVGGTTIDAIGLRINIPPDER
jgi:hypothetical protein